MGASLSKKACIALCLLGSVPATHAAPWTVVFGGCTFSGDTNGAPLARAGVCPNEVGQLYLSYKSINSLPESVFAGMENLE
jgi:hypothetical protein